MKERKVIIKTGLNLENSYASLPEIFFTRQSPSRVPSPKLAVLNYSLITSLGLNAQGLQSADGVDILAGNKTPEEAIPISQAYAGHQFGHFTMLGDGRAILLGNISLHKVIDLIFSLRVQVKLHIREEEMEKQR